MFELKVKKEVKCKEERNTTRKERPKQKLKEKYMKKGKHKMHY